MISGKANISNNSSNNNSLYNINLNTYTKNERYRLMVKHLQEKCRMIQKHNERVAYR